MSAVDLKKWMKRNGKTVIAVAHDSNVHFNTVYRYLSGKPLRPSSAAAIERLMEPNYRLQSGGLKATGT